MSRSLIERRRFRNSYVLNTGFSLGAGALFYFFWQRLFFGVDFTDESLYSALSVAFFKGSKPYFDELLIVQNAGILLQPLVWLYHLKSPDFSGIVLFFRHSYFLYVVIMGVIPFLFMNRYVDRWTSFWTTSLSLSFVPFAIPSLSYNTLTKSLLTVVVVLLSLYFVRRDRADTNMRDLNSKTELLLPLGVFLFVIAVVIYPTLGIAGIAVPVIIFYGWKRSGWTSSIVSSIVLITAVLGISCFLGMFIIGMPRISEILRYTVSMGVHTNALEKFRKAVELIKLNRIFYGPFFCVMMLLPFALRVPFLAPILVGALVYFLNQYALVDGMINHHLMIAFSLVPFFYLCFPRVRRFLKVHSELKFLWLASLTLGFTFAMTSGNGLVNEPMGSFGAVILAVLFLNCLVERSSKGQLALCIMILSLAQLRVFWMQHYGDDDVSVLSTTVPSGPYMGLKTTIEKQRFLNDLEKDLKASSHGSGTIAAFDSGAVVYLTSSLKPLTPTVWTYFSTQLPSDREILTNFYRQKNAWPDVLVWMKKLPIGRDANLVEGLQNDELKSYLLDRNKDVLAENEWYTIFRLH